RTARVDLLLDSNSAVRRRVDVRVRSTVRVRRAHHGGAVGRTSCGHHTGSGARSRELTLFYVTRSFLMPTVSARPVPYPIAPVRRGRAPVTSEVRAGMGAIPYGSGVAFRVWAPHATAVSVVGTFNNWDKAKHPMARENDDGYWYADLSNAKI